MGGFMWCEENDDRGEKEEGEDLHASGGKDTG